MSGRFSRTSRRSLLVSGAVLLVTGVSAAACGRFQPTTPERPSQLVGRVRVSYRQDILSRQVYGAIGEQLRNRHPAIQLELVEFAELADYTAALLVLFAAGTPPDVFWQRVVRFGAALQQKLLLNIEPYARRDFKAAQLDDIFPSNLELARVRGGLYGLPADGSGTNLFYNVGLFEREGLQQPGSLNDAGKWTVEAFLDAGKKLTQRSGGVIERWGAYDPLGGHLWWLPWVWAMGGEFLNKDNTQVLLDQRPAVDALQWQQDLIVRHGIIPTSDELAQLREREPNDRRAMFRNGRVAMITDYPTAVGAGRFREAEQQGLRWDATQVPSGRAGQFSIVFFHLHSIAAPTKVPELAWQVVTFFSGAQSDLLKSIAGATQPFRKSTAAAPEYLRTLPPAFARAMGKLGERARPFPLVVEDEKMQQVLGEEMQLLRAGKKSAPEVTQAIKQRVDPLVPSRL